MQVDLQNNIKACKQAHHRGFVKVQLNEGTYRMVGGFVDYPYIPTSSVCVEVAPVVWGFVICFSLNK